MNEDEQRQSATDRERSLLDTAPESVWSRWEARVAGFSSRWGRGLGWLSVGVVGAICIGKLESWGVDAYTARWGGSLFKVATAGWAGYRISKDILSIDPSMGRSDIERAILHLARAFVVGATIIAVCMAV